MPPGIVAKYGLEWLPAYPGAAQAVRMPPAAAAAAATEEEGRRADETAATEAASAACKD